MPTDVNGVTQLLTPAAQAANRPPNQAERPSAVNPTGNASSTPASSADSVELSTPGQVQALTEALQSVPVVDSQRVQDVRSALSAGELRVDPQRIAEKVVQFESMLHAGKLPDAT